VKVPAVKPYFWVVKLLTTAMGEAVSDYLVNDVNKYLAVVVGFILFAIAIRWQFRTPVYRTWPYWSAVAMVAVFGTMCADVMHIVLGLPYQVSATFYAVCLAVTFVIWHRTEGTLDIHSIVTRRREVFYWLAVIFTFAMGTALGDLLANTFHLGYLGSALVFTALSQRPVNEILNGRYLLGYAAGSLSVMLVAFGWGWWQQGKSFPLSTLCGLGMSSSNSGGMVRPIGPSVMPVSSVAPTLKTSARASVRIAK